MIESNAKIEYVVEDRNGNICKPYVIDLDNNEVSYWDDGSIPRIAKIQSTYYLAKDTGLIVEYHI